MTPDVAPPLSEGRYRLLSLLGEGGMAKVYRAYDARLDVDRAVKVLDARLMGSESAKGRFVSEARTMARLYHPNILTVHDVGVDEDRAWMVMELVEGGSLVDRVERDGALPPRMACQVTRAMLSGLQMAHENGVVHRDIKPHNVLLTREGACKVADFGIARVQNTDRARTRTGAVMGTWAYMAPEQRTNSKEVDARADLYAVGCTLWALVKNEDPFDLYSAEAQEELFQDIPEVLAAVIRKATRYKADDRYGSAAEMAAALLEIEPLLPPDPPSTRPLVDAAGLGGSRSTSARSQGTLTPLPVEKMRTGPGTRAADLTLDPATAEEPLPGAKPPPPPPRSPPAGGGLSKSGTQTRSGDSEGGSSKVGLVAVGAGMGALGGAALLGGLFLVLVAVGAALYLSVPGGPPPKPTPVVTAPTANPPTTTTAGTTTAGTTPTATGTTAGGTPVETTGTGAATTPKSSTPKTTGGTTTRHTTTTSSSSGTTGTRGATTTAPRGTTSSTTAPRGTTTGTRVTGTTGGTTGTPRGATTTPRR